jgi:curved DNA-binding protein CbpA
MSDHYFRDILGVAADASREQIRQAYRRLVMENHPDRFPVEKKSLQELTTITLTEAYNALMSSPAPEPPRRKPEEPPPQKTEPVPHGPGISPHRDPAYVYYKQGFINFSLAIHGIADVNRHIAAGRIPRFSRRYTAAEYFGGSLGFLRSAHEYFARVVEDHPESVWAADSFAKLRRIERFTKLYGRILSNLKRK